MVAPHEIGDPVRSYVRIPGSGSDKTAKSLCCDLSRVSLVAAAAPIPPEHVQEPQPTVSPNPRPNENDDARSTTAAETIGTIDANNNGREAAKVPVQTETQKQAVPVEHASRIQALPLSVIPAGNGSANVGRNITEMRNTENSKALAHQAGDGSVKEGRNITEIKTTENPQKRPYQEEEKNAILMPPQKQARMTSAGDGSSILISRVNCNNGGAGIGTTTCENPLSSVGTQTEALNDVVAQRNQLLQQNVMLERRLAVFKDIFTNKQRLARLLRCLEVPAQN